MAFGFSRDDVPADDLTWLGSKHGVGDARTVTLDGAAFAPVVRNGVIPSGVAIAEGADGLFTLASSSAAVVGFLLTAQKMDTGRIVAPLLDHGRVIAAKAPEQPVDVSEITSPHFIVIGGSAAGGAEGNG